MKKLFSLLTAILFAGSLLATSYISYEDDTQDESTTISSSNVSNGSAGKISWEGTSCTYSSNRVNIAANGSIAFTVADGYVITKIVITSGSSASYYGTWSTTSGSVSASSGVTTVSDINASSVTVTTSTAFRCTSASSIKIYYTEAGTTGVAKPQISGDETFLHETEVKITCPTEGATIYYTLDGTDPSATSTAYTAVFKLTETTTVKAIAIKGEDKATAEKKFTKATVLTVSQANEAVAALEDKGTIANQYVHGIISQIDSYSSGSITYWISDDGTTTDQFEVYNGKGLDGASFTSKDDLQEGDVVTVFGTLKKYGTIYEFDYGSKIVEFERPVPTDPIISAKDIDFGKRALVGEAENFVLDTTLAVTGLNLEAAITAVGSEHVTVSGTLTAEGGTLNVHIVAAPGKFSETITLSCGELEKKVTVSGSVVKPIDEDDVPGYTATMTKGETNSYDAKVNFSGEGHNAVRSGKSGGDGEMTITVPATTFKLHFFAAAWSGFPGDINISAPEGVKLNATSVTLIAESGVSGSSNDFTIDPVTTEHLFTIELTGVTKETKITLASGTAQRFVVWGAKYEATEVPSSLSNPELDSKAVKIFENGQLVIIKNGVRYNALGAQL